MSQAFDVFRAGIDEQVDVGGEAHDAVRVHGLTSEEDVGDRFGVERAQDIGQAFVGRGHCRQD
jgi:hypothetical protein